MSHSTGKLQRQVSTGRSEMEVSNFTISGPTIFSTYKGRFELRGRQFEFVARIVGELKGVSIDELEIRIRPYKLLKRSRIDTVDQLLEKSSEELLAIPGFGLGCLAEIEGALSSAGLRLRLSQEEL